MRIEREISLLGALVAQDDVGMDVRVQIFDSRDVVGAQGILERGAVLRILRVVSFRPSAVDIDRHRSQASAAVVDVHYIVQLAVRPIDCWG